MFHGTSQLTVVFTVHG